MRSRSPLALKLLDGIIILVFKLCKYWDLISLF